jgi:hypothetical protein
MWVAYYTFVTYPFVSDVKLAGSLDSDTGRRPPLLPVLSFRTFHICAVTSMACHSYHE